METAGSQLLQKLVDANIIDEEWVQNLGINEATNDGPTNGISFSIYGHFTDITIRSCSLDKYADLERNR